jgi:hypothetical protein
MTGWRIADRQALFAQARKKAPRMRLSDFTIKYSDLPLTAAAVKAQNALDAAFRASNF